MRHVSQPKQKSQRGDADHEIIQYKRVYSEENTAKAQYYVCALLINMYLLNQVIFASALNALGAGHSSHTQMTALEGANTVIAAILTFTKGSGLPNRLRQHQQTLRKVREYIEQRERDFAQSDCKLSIEMEMRTIKQMYAEAREADEKNDPSSYHSPGAVPTQDGPLSQKLTHERPLTKITAMASPLTPPPPTNWPVTPHSTIPAALRSSSEEHETPQKSEDIHTEGDSLDSFP